MRATKTFLLAWACLLAVSEPGLAVKASRSETALLVAVDDPELASLALAGAGQRGPVLLFDPRDAGFVEHAIQSSGRRVECMRRSATPVEVAELMERMAGTPCELADDPFALARRLWPGTRVAIVEDPQDELWRLRSAAFGGATGSAVLSLQPTPAPPLEQLRSLGLETLYLTPPFLAWKEAAATAVPNIVPIASPVDLARELVHLVPNPPTALVIANPTDQHGVFSPSSLSLLAPLVSAAHQAPLFLTERHEAADIESEALSFLSSADLKPTHIILVGDELALRSHRVPDPVLTAGGPEARGGGTVIRTELFSEIQNDAPQDFVVGRIVAEDAVIGSGLLARQLHDNGGAASKPVRFLVNADSVFELGEVISRSTVHELQNVHIPVQASYRSEVTADRIKRSLAEAGLLVWEGHPRDLTLEQNGAAEVKDAPPYVVLQGCYTFDRSDPFILIEKGTQAIVATSAAVYSAPGAAFTRALFDSSLYEHVDLGTAVRNARNYLLAVARLQRERGHNDWRKTWRAALAFALWGDPTLHLPLTPAKPKHMPVHWTRNDSTLNLDIPSDKLRDAAAGPYRAQPASRAMLSGLVLPQGNERWLKELYFTVTPGGDSAMAACAPDRGWDVVSLYGPRSGSLFFLARPDWTLIHASAHAGRFSFPLVVDSHACPTSAPRDSQVDTGGKP
jgi:hypothetical protein